MTSRSKVLVWTLGSALAISAGALVIFAVAASGPRQDSPDRIQAACESEYGVGTPRAADCSLSLLMEYAEKDDARRRRDAAREAGVR